MAAVPRNGQQMIFGCPCAHLATWMSQCSVRSGGATQWGVNTSKFIDLNLKMDYQISIIISEYSRHNRHQITIYFRASPNVRDLET